MSRPACSGFLMFSNIFYTAPLVLIQLITHNFRAVPNKCFCCFCIPLQMPHKPGSYISVGRIKHFTMRSIFSPHHTPIPIIFFRTNCNESPRSQCLSDCFYVRRTLGTDQRMGITRHEGNTGRNGSAVFHQAQQENRI